jgi:hypothetical protein
MSIPQEVRENNMKYFIGFLVSVGLIVLVIILVMRGLSGGPKPVIQAPLSDYASTTSVVRLTVAGPIVGDQQFHSYQITVGRDQASIETRKGYQNSVIDQKSYANNQEAYFNFLRALDLAGFTKGDTKSPNKDERGMCAIGDRYVVQIKNDNSDVERFWTSTCRGQNGNFRGSIDQVRLLFNKQIPIADFSKLTNSLNL